MPSARPALWTIAARLSRNATLILLAATLAAAEPAPFISDADWSQPKAAPAAGAAAPASPGRALATMAVALAAILGLGIGSLVLIRRLGGRRRAAAAPRHLGLVETLPLGAKRAVAVLRIGDHVVLVGSHEHGLTGLGVLPASVLGTLAPEPGAASGEPAAPATAPPAMPPGGTGAAFAAVLENLLGEAAMSRLRQVLLVLALLAGLGAAEAPGPAPVVAPEPITTATPVTAPAPAPPPGAAATPPGVTVSVSPGTTGGFSSALTLLLVITALAVAPAFLMMMTSFTRVIIVLGFVRRALGTQTLPPNQVMLGLALFLSLFIMAPTIKRLNEQALQPYLADAISQKVALDRAGDAARDFMLKHTRKHDLALFIRMAGQERPKGPQDVSLLTLIPAFITSEIKTAFQMGFVIFLPFLVIDLVVSAVLMALGMMMLPPAVVSLPFKILLFVLVDGWVLLLQGLVASYA